MAYDRVFVGTKVWDRQTLQELHKLIVQKEKEGWEVIKPAHTVQRSDFEGSMSRTRWAVVMRYVQKTS